MHSIYNNIFGDNIINLYAITSHCLHQAGLNILSCSVFYVVLATVNSQLSAFLIYCRYFFVELGITYLHSSPYNEVCFATNFFESYVLKF